MWICPKVLVGLQGPKDGPSEAWIPLLARTNLVPEVTTTDRFEKKKVECLALFPLNYSAQHAG